MFSFPIRCRSIRHLSARIALCCFACSVLFALPAVGQTGLALATDLVTSDLVRPLGVVSADDGTGRLFIVQQDGEIRIWNGVSLEATPFLDLSGEVICCNERGLLGLAFHPDYASNGELFVDYTRDEGGQLQSVVARYTVSMGDPDVADAGSEEILLVFDQPNDNHNGGSLAFGPDGYLYIAAGDGGGSGDPNESGQNLSTVLGKILRIDVDGTPGPGLDYAIPASNPFVGVAGAREEIWAYGLRNPFRVSFDRETGDFWIADVGQTMWEEVDLQPAASTGGQNYGWDCREGAHIYTGPDNDGNAGCSGLPFVDPILEYAHSDAGGGFRCSITGGFRYRGAEERLRGVYLYGDFCSGEIFGTVPRCDGAWESRVLLDTGFRITTFGEDASGEIYVTDRENTTSATSEVYKLRLANGSGGPDLAPTTTTLDFGTVEVGDTVERAFSLTNANAGPGAAAVTASTLSDPARFALDAGAGAKPCKKGGKPCLSPGAGCTEAVRFQGDATGAVSETLTLEGNFAPETITLTANVIACSSDLDLTISGATVTGTEVHRACDTLTATDVTVASGGDLTLRAGTLIALGDGFSVASGGSLTLEIF
jgi:glucose/arabinose dehydrogenase